MKILVGISGASGVELGFYLLNALERFTRANDEIFAIISKGAQMSFCAENSALKGEMLEFRDLNLALKDNLRGFKGKNSNTKSNACNGVNSSFKSKLREENLLEFKSENLVQEAEFEAFCKDKFALFKTSFLDDENLAQSVASGSFGINATIITPCSLNSLAKIRQGIADTLITRSAAVALKERKKLILCVREMPFSTLALKQMTKLSKMGAIIAPPVFASYAGGDLVSLRNFIIGKLMDLLEIKHDLYKRWV